MADDGGRENANKQLKATHGGEKGRKGPVRGQTKQCQMTQTGERFAKVLDIL